MASDFSSILMSIIIFSFPSFQFDGLPCSVLIRNNFWRQYWCYFVAKVMLHIVEKREKMLLHPTLQPEIVDIYGKIFT
ncbi:hypothetical protein V1477_003690 [Vespula maculifrons]|uniref:Uncharacterized protein n=1 Tax=Vespula maculifrons TaxID=7453 RepID=A0ABD2CRR6_VESMC